MLQTNGLTETFNQTLTRSLAKLVNYTERIQNLTHGISCISSSQFSDIVEFMYSKYSHKDHTIQVQKVTIDSVYDV